MNSTREEMPLLKTYVSFDLHLCSKFMFFFLSCQVDIDLDFSKVQKVVGIYHIHTEIVAVSCGSIQDSAMRNSTTPAS